MNFLVHGKDEQLGMSRMCRITRSRAGSAALWLSLSLGQLTDTGVSVGINLQEHATRFEAIGHVLVRGWLLSLATPPRQI